LISLASPSRNRVSASDSQSVESSTPVGQQRALTWTARRGILVAVGLSIYVGSFFLLAIGDLERLVGPVRGYSCAELTLVSPFAEDGRSLLHEKPIEYFSLLGSGLINPLFLTAFFLQLFRARPMAIIVLRNLTILMIPLCWVYFRYEHFYPREGHFLWIVGMLLTLFAMSSSQTEPPKVHRA
jgi:hypothetical protein